MDWLETERAWFSPKRELKRLKRRAQARWLIVVCLTTILAGLGLKRLAKTPSSYEARIIMRITELDLLRDSSPVVGRHLSEYLLDATLRTEGLAELLVRNGLYVDEVAANKSLAAKAFREELEVEVYRNYFAVSRGYAGGARTARVSLRYLDSEPERAMTVAREVAELMAATEAANRRRASLKLASIGRLASAAAETRLDALIERQVTQIGALERAADKKSAESAALRVEIRGLSKAIDHQSDRLARARAQLQQIELRDAVIGSRLGIDFRIVDERPPEVRARVGLAFLGMVGIVLCVIFLPFVAIGVGAFDVRVHDAADARRLGLGILGQLDES